MGAGRNYIRLDFSAKLEIRSGRHPEIADYRIVL
jgi:hypothetical protein